jgi:hypothetical protein
MKIGIVCICTNAYFILGLRFIKHFAKYYKGKHDIEFIVFSDTDPKPFLPNIKNITYIPLTNESWVDATNSKFSSIASLESSNYDHLYYFDADTDIDKPFDDWYLGDIVGGEHFNNRYPEEKPYDRNPNSKAYIPLDTPLPQMYYYGAFFGGKKENVIKFVKILIENQKIDKLIPYEPGCNDESYINQYFHYIPPSYAVPTENFKFIISDKGGLEDTRNPKLDIQKYKDEIMKNPLQPFKLRDGIISFEMEGGARRRGPSKKTKKRRRNKN